MMKVGNAYNGAWRFAAVGMIGFAIAALVALFILKHLYLFALEHWPEIALNYVRNRLGFWCTERSFTNGLG